MLRVLLSVTMMTAVLAVPLTATVAHAQTGAGAVSFQEGSNRTMDIFFDVLFWLLILLAVVFLAMAIFSYATAFNGPKAIRAANYRILFTVITIAVAVLVRLLVFVLERKGL